MTLWHKIEHRLGWNRGSVVSRTDAQGHIWIGFQCSGCGEVRHEFDRTAEIDESIRKYGFGKGTAK